MLSEETENWIWESTPNGRFTSSSAQVQDILGYSPVELVGKTFTDFLAPCDVVRAMSGLTEALAKKEAFHSLLLCAMHRNGREVELEITGNPFFPGMGLFPGSMGLRGMLPAKIRMRQHILPVYPGTAPCWNRPAMRSLLLTFRQA